MPSGAGLLPVPLSPPIVPVGLGPGGIAALGIGTAPIVAGLFLRYRPQARAYVPVHALLLSVLSFVVTDLGGFLVGAPAGHRGLAARSPELRGDVAPYLTRSAGASRGCRAWRSARTDCRLRR
ncbi:DUF6114 domain-containing protein [Streptomyces sp. NPDC093801]|uniref:DUF6114 domain-containing protein n=1 Tax=Streptomyces sp. NPDC093801 TaxID=3155203 RepID=UPI00344B666C